MVFFPPHSNFSIYDFLNVAYSVKKVGLNHCLYITVYKISIYFIMQLCIAIIDKSGLLL